RCILLILKPSMKKFFIRSMQFLLILILLVAVGAFLYMRHARFGADASGDRLTLMESKPNYKNGAFENVEVTPALTEGASTLEVFGGVLFKKKVRNVPEDSIPVVKTDLHALPADSNVYVWFGHSSYYIQLDGKK